MDEKLIRFNNRAQYIQSINSFISTTKVEVNSYLNILGWTEENTIKKEKLLQCPFEDSHRVPEKNLQVHLESCPCRPPGKDTGDKTLLIASNDGQSEARPESSLAESPALTEFLLPYNTTKQAEPKTLQEILKAERDAKRRRIRYRCCKVHTKSRSHTEVLRGVIESQMLALEDWIKQEKGIFEDDEESSRSENKSVETKTESTNMIWLDWNFRGNPHLRWKDVIKNEEQKNVSKNDNGKTVGSDYDRDYKRRYERNNRSRSRSYDKQENYRSHYDTRKDCRKYESRRGRSDIFERDDKRRKGYVSYSHKRHEIDSTSTTKSRDRYNGTKMMIGHKRYRDDSIGRHTKHKKHRYSHKKRHHSRSSSEKQSYSSSDSENYRRKKHSKKKKKSHKHSKHKESTTATSDSESN